MIFVPSPEYINNILIIPEYVSLDTICFLSETFFTMNNNIEKTKAI